ncbi:UDP-N-acetylmuramate dehydrogenase [Desulfonema magnum]|nr:UDP-N-acetylmuramate dehydrogenase [Desulfonema magnum]
MSEHTSFRVGGPADVYITPETPEELAETINGVRQRKLNYLVIGGGTNLLVSDSGIRGVVIVLGKCLNKITHTATEKENLVALTAGAGAKLHRICRFAITQGLQGMNFALGIPGTVGGAVMMNAGTASGSVEGVIDSVNVLLPEGRTRKIQKKDLNFEYRKLSWNMINCAEKKSDFFKPIILDGEFHLRPSDPVKLKKEAEHMLKTRKKTQPANLPSAGCFFKNPMSGKTAGELIDLAGLKGKKIGGAEVSPIHANFIINSDRASAADILALKSLIQETVSELFDIDLETEVKIIGE